MRHHCGCRRCLKVVQVDNHNFTAGQRDVAVGGEAADAVVRRISRNRVIDVNKLFVAKFGSKATPSSALAVRINCQGYKRRRQQRTVLDHAQLPALKTNKDTSVRRELHCGRTG